MDLKQVAKLYAETNSGSAVGRRLGIAERRGREYVAEAKAQGLITGSVIPLHSFPIPETPKLTTHEMLELLHERLNDDHYESIKKSGRTKSVSNESINTVLSDHHMGALVKDKNGDEIFNVEIARDRARSTCERAISLTKRHIKSNKDHNEKVDELNIFLLGDMIDGLGIYESQAYSIELFPPHQVLEEFRVLKDFIRKMRELDIPIKIWGVPGNHGENRTSFAFNTANNWDLALYLFLEEWIKDNKISNVKMCHSEIESLDVNIKGHKFLLQHQVVRQAITPAMSGKVIEWMTQVYEGCEAMIGGHWHFYQVADIGKGKLYLQCGSIQGINDLSRRMAKATKPSQLIFGTTKEELTTFTYRVRV